MIFVNGHVHCDPHPGNILVRRSPKHGVEIVFLDHGLYQVWSFRIHLQSWCVCVCGGGGYSPGLYKLYRPLCATPKGMVFEPFWSENEFIDFDQGMVFKGTTRAYKRIIVKEEKYPKCPNNVLTSIGQGNGSKTKYNFQKSGLKRPENRYGF